MTHEEELQDSKGVTDPMWDYEQCRCDEETLELCAYCVRFEQLDTEEEL